MATSKSKDKTEGKSKGRASASKAAADPNIRLDEDAGPLFRIAGTLGVIGLAVSLLLGMGNFKQFSHSYLVSFMWALSIGIGALWWVTLQHLVNAHWSVVVRRVAELLASNMTLFALLAMPIVIPLLVGNSSLYAWADHHRVEADHLLHHKAPYLNIGFFAARFIVYFGFWAFLGQYFKVHSLRQDQSGKDEHRRMAKVAPPAMIVIALTLTFCAIDFVMSLDATWFSTIFGVYYFAGCVLTFHSTLALALMWLQSKGRLVGLVTVEHYHDIGKMMFAFIVFWAYIAFSQFLLIWYANIPEETAWYRIRLNGGWGVLAWTLLIGHFVIPFVGLISRQVKRNRKGLAFWAVWILAMDWIDMYWLVMPQLSPERVSFHVLDVTCFVGIAGLFVASAAFQAKQVNLIPTKDPRLSKSLAFENI
jgi:hypothetical protein